VRRFGLAVCGLWLGVVACTPKPDPLAIVRNSCARDADCQAGEEPLAQEASCNLSSRRCEHARASVPYPLVLQVTLTGTRGQLVPRYTLPSQTLDTRIANARIEVPDAVTARGAIRRSEGGDFVSAAVTFVPVAADPDTTGYPVAAETFYTWTTDDSDTNLTVPLAPGTLYDVRIEPLGGYSTTLPPGRSSVSFDASGTGRFDFAYPALSSVTLRLLDPQNMPLRGAHVRLVDHESGAVVSSTNQSADDGSVTLYAEAAKLAAGSDIMLGVSDGSPWLVQVRADPKRLVQSPDDDTPTLTVPALPAQVLYEGRVAMPSDVLAELVDPTELVFVSSFPVPASGSAAVDRDWCRALRMDDPLPPFACSAEISASTAPNGQFSVSLLPGEYDIFARPSGASEAGQEVRTVLLEGVLVQSPGAGAAQGGQQIELKPAVPYAGRVVAPDRRAGPNVTVRAEALDVRTDPGAIRDVARYARSIETITDERGNFAIGVDYGYYDLSLRPSSDTGFAWSYITNREVTEREADGAGLGPLVLQSPVLYGGTLVSMRGNPVQNATVDAYAVIMSIDGTSRAVQVGSTSSDDQGRFELLLPPTLDGEQSAE